VSLERSVFFPPFRLDLANERLWRLAQPLPLRPKTFAVLRCFVEHPGQLLTKEALFEAVWPATVVSDVVLKVCVRELRHALGDNARQPRFIETVHGRGYRFIGSVTAAPQPAMPQDASKRMAKLQSPEFVGARLDAAHGPIVGREVEIASLHQCLDKVWSGTRQVVFVTGEAGLGKTTVVEAFVTEAGRRGELWIGHGQCMEHYGAGEAYMPVLEALEQLCRSFGGQALVSFLARQAPTWLVQMPWLLSAADLDRLQRSTLGATRERMLREIVRALEVLSAERPLVLVLEDLHWSDYATLDLLTMLARRQESARLLVLGTYRLEEVLGKEHPLATLTQELQIHGHSQELPLTLLTKAAVRTYLTARLPGAAITDELAQCIHQRTEGNPLFMVTMVDYVVAQDMSGALMGSRNPPVRLVEAARGMPESLRQMLERRFDRLRPEEQGVLEVGSVVGNEFAAAVVAAGLGVDIEQIEVWCEGLARRGQWLQSRGHSAWPDGTVSACYDFIHALYQEAVYNRIPAARRLRLHGRIGERLVAGNGEQTRALAVELAVHFEQGREYHRAVHYCQQAAENALQRYAYREAIMHLTRGLTLLQRLPDTPECLQQELAVQITLGPALMATKGMAAPEIEQTYARARELCQQAGETPQLLHVLFGLWQCYLVRGEVHVARELAAQCLGVAQHQHDPAALLVAHWVLGVTLFYLGEFALARTHAEQGIALSNAQQPYSHIFFYGQAPSIGCLGHTAQALWMLGYPDQAQQRSHEALALARELSHPYDVVFALNQAVVLHQLRREGRSAYERAEEVLTFCTEQGFTQQLAMGTILQGWGIAAQGQIDKGIAQMHQGLAASQAAGIGLGRAPVLAQMAEAYWHTGQTDEGLRLLAEALAVMDRTGERWWEAEVYRLRGELLLAQESTRQKCVEAEACFRHALEVARQQQAKSLELRAAMSMSRLWQRQGRCAAAYHLLADIYGWFTEGFDTVDLQEAKALLEQTGGTMSVVK
jgi:predicted ATPase/DNA-binding winged helix-turn-helix (wHTH) protein